MQSDQRNISDKFNRKLNPILSTIGEKAGSFQRHLILQSWPVKSLEYMGFQFKEYVIFK